jgi:ribosomal protection tetracycline resistance protein
VRTLNLGIVAHVDAGKTSLTERLLYAAGVIGEIGSVDDGTTQTDSLALERQRGITIKSAVATFAIDDLAVNLIDTPGHPDFIAEVERALGVLDGAVLVVSAVEGVQAQTRVLMRTLRRLRIPTLIFVNKIDRGGARDEGVLRGMAQRLTPAVVAMGSVSQLGTRAASFAPGAGADARFAARLIDVLARHDDALLATYVDDETALSASDVRLRLAAQTRRALVHPVFFGSAVTGAGVTALMAGIAELLPAAADDSGGPVSAAVFKIERGPAREKIAYVRMFSGTLRVRDRPQLGSGGSGKVTGIRVLQAGLDVVQASVSAGQIGKLWGLADARLGDAIGVPRLTAGERHFAPPTLETIVVPARPAARARLHDALTMLAEQDPLINVRQDDIRQEVSVSLYGEVQKEVIQATLADDFGLDVTFRKTTTIYLERPLGAGAAAEVMHERENPFLATVGLRIEPAPAGAGLEFRLGVELGSMPLAFIKAVEETVAVTLREGLHGWQVSDAIVTMTQSGYAPRQSHAHGTFDKSMSSTAGDFRNLTPLVVMSALRQGGTRVFEPVHRFSLDLPADTLAPALSLLARLRATVRAPAIRGASCLLEGQLPAACVHELEQRLPGITRGEGTADCAFDRYEPVSGAPPTRQRSDHNPLDRKEYLLRVVRRAGSPA